MMRARKRRRLLLALLVALTLLLGSPSRAPAPPVADVLAVGEVAFCLNTALLAQLVSAEARGEPLEGQIAVANVVLNRVRSPLFPDTIHAVIYQAGQFCAAALLPKLPTESAWRAAHMAMAGVRVVGEDVLFFFNPRTAGCGWIRTREVAQTIGRHRFTLAQRGR